METEGQLEKCNTNKTSCESDSYTCQRENDNCRINNDKCTQDITNCKQEKQNLSARPAEVNMNRVLKRALKKVSHSYGGHLYLMSKAIPKSERSIVAFAEKCVELGGYLCEIESLREKNNLLAWARGKISRYSGTEWAMLGQWDKNPTGRTDRTYRFYRSNERVQVQEWCGSSEPHYNRYPNCMFLDWSSSSCGSTKGMTDGCCTGIRDCGYTRFLCEIEEN